MNKKFENLIKNKEVIGMDTNIFIYQFQAHPKYSLLTNQLFLLLERKKVLLNTSFISLIEVLSFPGLKDKKNLSELYETFLLHTDSLKVIYPNLSITKKTIELRKKYKFSVPDCLQIASAWDTKSKIFITNDEKLKKVEEVETVLLGDYLS